MNTELFRDVAVAGVGKIICQRIFNVPGSCTIVESIKIKMVCKRFKRSKIQLGKGQKIPIYILPFQPFP